MFNRFINIICIFVIFDITWGFAIAAELPQSTGVIGYSMAGAGCAVMALMIADCGQFRAGRYIPADSVSNGFQADPIR